MGLATDLDRLRLPCCETWVFRVEGIDSGLRVDAGRGEVEVRPDPTHARAGVFRLQVAALKDEGQAVELARRLEQQTGEPSDVAFDAAIDLYRVRLGRHPDRDSAERAARLLEVRGLGKSWIVSEGETLEGPAFEVSQAGRHRRLAGRWLAIEGEDGTVTFAGRRYRGRLLLFLTARGKLNVINELGVDDYLRGVLPREMGPALYPRIEALKAQAVAARTYLLRNLGEFASEGYDICATERCQVYGGMADEHPLSDRAVAETAGEILVWRGRPADSLYSASCGGHTEDAAVVFPAKSAPYLEGVACREIGPRSLRGEAAPSAALEAVIADSVAPVAAEVESRTAALELRLAALARRAGLPTPVARLTSVERSEVAAWLAALLPSPPADPEAARSLSELLAGGPTEVEPREQERLVHLTALVTGVVERQSAHFLDLRDGRLLKVRQGREHRDLTLAAGWTAQLRRGGSSSTTALEVSPGDVLELYLVGERVLAVVGDAERLGATETADESWVRFRSRAHLARLVAERYPGFELADLEVLERGPSGRVARLRLVSTAGEEAVVEGLAIRWTLDLPETWFTVEPARSEERSGWLFRGRGLGHGVGLCQRGAFALAGADNDYRDILHHYYNGLELGTFATARVAAVSP